MDAARTPIFDRMGSGETLPLVVCWAAWIVLSLAAWVAVITVVSF